jgi:ABC-type multidrug transport system fused ATPase/permease subunit
LRFNIDPNGILADDDIKSLMREAGLQDLLTRGSQRTTVDNKKKSPETTKEADPLEFEIQEGGQNLSSGEKQLICIVRAILRKNQIIVLDEATANIDLVTEEKIQKLVNEQFKDFTVITIAHRLQTIINSDKVLVLGDG